MFYRRYKGVVKSKKLMLPPRAAGSMFLLTVLLSMSFLFAGCRAHSESFVMVALPDTQYYSLYSPEIFSSQTQWIKSRSTGLNIKWVVHEGDITHTNTEKEWQNALQAMSVLDGTVPYCLCIGNHDDFRWEGAPLDNQTQLYDTYFPVAHFDQYPWFGDHYGSDISNAYYLFEIADLDFMLICLEFGASDAVLGWANAVVEAHPLHRTIVATHCYMNYDDTRVGADDEYNPHVYAGGDMLNDGEEIWDKFVRRHKNIFLVLSGHVLGDGIGRLTSVGDHGNSVHQLLSNYQMKDNGGSGLLRIITFVPREDKIVVQTYSPVLKKYYTDAENQFELNYSMK